MHDFYVYSPYHSVLLKVSKREFERLILDGKTVFDERASTPRISYADLIDPEPQEGHEEPDSDVFADQCDVCLASVNNHFDGCPEKLW